jgi:hypothetical protein
VNVVRVYNQVVAGVSEVTRQRAHEARQGRADPGTPTASAVAAAEQAVGVARGVAATARTGRQILLGLLRAEVARSAARIGLASPAEVDRLARRVEALERRLKRVEGGDTEQRHGTGQGQQPPATPADMPPVAHPPAAPEQSRRKRTPSRRGPAAATTTPRRRAAT